MGKEFTLRKNGTGRLQGWDHIGNSPYGKTDIETIKDPAGETASIEITSIPSPFARMDLVKNAFDYVNKHGLEGKTIYHLMVSHTLDIAQIFFNAKKFINLKLIEIIKWDRTSLSALKGATGTKLMGDTLELFLQNNAYNSDSLDGIYLLRYLGPGAGQMTIIGGTSPLTLFFSSANDFSNIGDHIKFGLHRVLGRPDDSNSTVNKFQSLPNRTDDQFIRYLYALQGDTDNFHQLFPEFDDYLTNCVAHLRTANNLKADVLAGLGNAELGQFHQLFVSQGNPVEVLGLQLYQGGSSINSDFALKPTKSVGGDMPLLLPLQKFSMNWIYVTTRWNPDTEVKPALDDEGNEIPLDRRTLPDDGSTYPYLTAEDFLTPYLIDLGGSRKVLSEDFFDGGINTEMGHAFLLPVKRRYFDYFSTDDLRKNLKMTCKSVDGQKVSVEVALNVPLKKGVMTLTKTYNEQESGITPIYPLDGVVIKKKLTLALFPMCKSVEPIDYLVHLMNSGEDDLSLVGLDSNGHETKCKGDIAQSSNSHSYDFEGPIESIEVKAYLENGIYATGLALPVWRGEKGSSIFKFAIDFGTTNTHVEYTKSGNKTLKPLDMTCQQLGALSDVCSIEPYSKLMPHLDVPKELGQKEAKFPMRSVFTFVKGTSWKSATEPYLTGNFSYCYGRQPKLDFIEDENDLKWSEDEDNAAKIRCCLESVVMMLRNKVLMEGGDLQKTKVVWFYPISMEDGRKSLFAREWNEIFEKYFGQTVRPSSLPESLAPYIFFNQNKHVSSYALTIDIGGGSSDALVTDGNGKPAFITSFKFAANDLTGDPFSKGDAENNGWVKRYKKVYGIGDDSQSDEDKKKDKDKKTGPEKGLLEQNNLAEQVSILKGILEENSSANFISSLFALKDNPNIAEKTENQKKVDFLRKLQSDKEAKTLFLIFYSAIIYHMARMIKKKRDEGLDVREPASIAFSGNGSKLLQMLNIDIDDSKELLEEYTKAIFAKVNNKDYPEDSLEIIAEKKCAKEATCKGGLEAIEMEASNDRQKEIKEWKATPQITLLGTKDARIVDKTKKVKYSELSQADYESVKQSISDFADMFFKLADEMDIKAKFGTIEITDLNKYRDYFTKGIGTHITNALNFLNYKGDKVVNDSLFFYPISYILNKMANDLFK